MAGMLNFALRSCATWLTTLLQMDTTPIGTCIIPPKPGEASDGLPGFQMVEATLPPKEERVLKGMKNGRLPIQLVRTGAFSWGYRDSESYHRPQAYRYQLGLLLLSRDTEGRRAITSVRLYP